MERFGLEVKFQEFSSNRRIWLDMITLEESVDTVKERAEGQSQGHYDNRRSKLAKAAEKEYHVTLGVNQGR